MNQQSNDRPASRCLLPLTILVCLLFGGHAKGQGSGLVSQWSFNAGQGTIAADSSGLNSANLIRNPQWVPGREGSAIRFDGYSQFAIVPNSASLNVSRITVSCWVYKHRNSSTWSMLAHRAYGSSWDELWMLFYFANSTNDYAWWVRTGPSTAAMIQGPSSIPDLNTWVHLAGTYDGSNIKLYRNGVLIGSAPLTGDIVPQNTVASFGAASDNNGSTFYQYAGVLMDDMRLYNRALSETEIQALAGVAAPDATPPSVPTNLTGTAVSSTTVNLAWSPSTDNVAVTGYRVTRNGVVIGTTSATSLTDNGTSPAQTYSYTVAAYDAAGNTSAPSTTAVVATPPLLDSTPPTVPASVVAVASSSTSVDLSWTGSTDNVAVTGYRVYRAGVQIGTSPTTTYSDTGLTPSTAYSYTVAAYDAAGNVSAQSAAANATTQAPPDTTAPSTPAGLTAAAISSTQINLSWTASTDNVAVTGYRVYRAGVQIGTSPTTTYSDTGLTPSTAYSYTVAAYDAAGNASAQSAAANATTQAPPDTTAPSTPAGLTAAAISSTQINLAWTASTDNVAVTGYRVYRAGVQVGTSPTTTYSDTGLTPSTAYSYTVAAHDAAGNVSAQSAAANATTQAPPDTTAPSAPAGLTAAAISSTQINLSWTASTDNVAVTGYRVYRASVQVGTSATTTYSDTGLTPSTAYSYTVAAYDAAGNVSAQSSAANTTTQAPPDTTAPSTPAGLTATAISSTQINLSWTASTDNVAVTGYRVYRAGVQIGTSPTTTYSDTGLTPSTAYSYTVAAYDAAGNVSAQSAAANATTQAPPDTTEPSTPAGLGATAISSTQINLAWTASTDNVAVTGYRVYRAGVQIGTSATTTYSDTGLTPSTAYSYTVAAHDAAGNVSAQSTAANATTQAPPDTTAPSTPAGLTAAAISSTQINLSWTASTDNVAVTGYRVYRAGVQIGTSPTTTYSDTGLTPSTAYSYTVAAYDAAGNVSAQSAAANATTQAPPDTTEPSTPAGLGATAISSTQIDLAWTASTDNVAVTGYRVYRASVQVGTSATTTYSDTGLTPSTAYSYTVAAYDAAGNVSAQSSAANTTTPGGGTGLVSHWSFDDGTGSTASDLTGANPATLIRTPSWSPGIIGSAVGFNGYDTFAVIPSSSSLNVSRITFSTWVHKRSNSPTWSMIGHRAYGTSWDELWMLFYWASSQANYAWMVTTGPSSQAIIMGPSSSGDVGQWVHLAGTYDGAMIRLYRNGVEIGSAPLTGNIPAQSTKVSFGAGSDNNGATFYQYANILMDDARLYDRALSQSEIQALYAAGVPPPATKRIMPLGDSLTLGALSGTESGNGGYRAGLWSSLTNGNYPVNFVGSLSYGPVGMDPDHEGHGGWRTDEISANIVTWLNMTLPDVVLLHIGTNDIIQGSSTSLVSSRIATLVDQIVANRPDARILVASVIPVRIPNDFGVTNESINSLNAEIQSLVSTRAAQGKKVTFVNMNGLAGLTSTDFSPDGLHLAGSGYSKMAAVWFTALTPFLN